MVRKMLMPRTPWFINIAMPSARTILSGTPNTAR